MCLYRLLLFLGASGSFVAGFNKTTYKFRCSEGSIKESFSENEESITLKENSKAKRIGQIVQRFNTTLRKTSSSITDFV